MVVFEADDNSFSKLNGSQSETEAINIVLSLIIAYLDNLDVSQAPSENYNVKKLESNY